jgi:enoyl-[acyl-carrier protein] reductase II
MSVVHVPKRPTFHTAVTELLDIEYPIIQGAMAWLSEAELVAAVSNEGGLGVLGASIMSVAEFEVQVVRAKKLTDRPFAVNFPLVLGEYSAHLEMCLDHGVRIVFMSAGSPKLLTPRIKKAGALCVHVVPNLKLAQRAVECGVDAIVLESYEAGGHVSQDGVTAITNIPNVARKIDVPLIAAGGIVDGYGMAAALALGADGIQMGTRFLAVEESNAPAIYQKMLLEAGEEDVPVFSKKFHPARALKSPFTERVLEMEKQERPTEEVRAFIGKGRAKKAAHQGNVEEGIFYAGAGAAMVEDVLTVRELFDQILAEYREAVGRAASFMAPARRAPVVEEGDETAILFKSHG